MHHLNNLNYINYLDFLDHVLLKPGSLCSCAGVHFFIFFLFLAHKMAFYLCFFVLFGNTCTEALPTAVPPTSPTPHHTRLRSPAKTVVST